jgi:SAM-dependent methyltransferase
MSPASGAGQATVFGTVAELYDRARPGYPPQAVEFVLPPDPGLVLELGAGTGQLTRSLTGRGLNVIAMDPDAQMLAVLRERLSGVEVRRGRAEQIPLPDRCVGVVLVAQAWHWVDPEAASAEIARVLAPAGRLGLLWNIRDDRDPWARQLTRVLGCDPRLQAESTTPTLGRHLTNAETFSHDWLFPTTRRGVLDLALTRSDALTKCAEGRQSLLDRLAGVLDHAGDATLHIAYTTRCHRARPARPARAG